MIDPLLKFYKKSDYRRPIVDLFCHVIPSDSQAFSSAAQSVGFSPK
jgi:hypothetical protein